MRYKLNGKQKQTKKHAAVGKSLKIFRNNLAFLSLPLSLILSILTFLRYVYLFIQFAFLIINALRLSQCVLKKVVIFMRVEKVETTAKSRLKELPLCQDRGGERESEEKKRLGK